jgi:elongation factor Ts
MAISATDVKKLREATGAAMLDCKNALEQSNGDFDRAMEWLKEKGLAKAAKKADRVTQEGRVEVYVHPGNRVAVMVEINCETDFVAKTEAFQNFAHEVALHIAMANPKYLDATAVPEAELEAIKAEGRSPEKYYEDVCLMQQPFVKNESITIGQMLKEAIAAIGENMNIRRFVRYELGQ